ncbi:LuxR C-terminal-related transcriptional regulator [Eggerthellaceae bacterium 24-137]
MSNPLARIHLDDLASSVAFRFLGLGFAWSWAWTLWGVLSSLEGGNSFGIASSPAWIVSTASCVAALAVFGWAFSTGRLSPNTRWVIVAGLLATGSSALLGIGGLLGTPAPLPLLTGAAAGIGAALLYLLWTSAYARAPQVRGDVVIPLCAAVTVLPVLVISGSIPLASWAFAAALPAISALMLLLIVKRDIAPDTSEKPTMTTPIGEIFSALGIPAAALFALHGLIGTTSGSASFVGAGSAATFEGVFAILGTAAALALAVAALNRPHGGAPDYLRWALTGAAIGALLYLQEPEELRLIGVALFRVTEVLAFIFTFTYALGRTAHDPRGCIAIIAVLLVASELGDLAGNLIGSMSALEKSSSDEFVLVGLFASLCLVTSLLGKPADSARTEAPIPVTAPSDDTEAICDAIARAYSLAPRQRDVLVHLAAGRTVARISQALTMSENTVASYVKQIYARLGVHSKQELIDFVQCYRQVESL